MINTRTEIPVKKLLHWFDLRTSKYYEWIDRKGEKNTHNGNVPKKHWILDWERDAIIDYARKHIGEGYRRLTYMMLDENIVAVSPATTYRVLKNAGMLNKWNKVKHKPKGLGFEQPTTANEHWHIDIKYVNFKGTFLFLIDIIDGYSRYIVHHDLRMNMQEYDIEITLQQALEKFPGTKPRIISDNGTQFISKDFTEYLRFAGLQHIRTSICYPQGNGKIERFHGTINQECLSKSSLINLEDAKNQIASYINHYNTKRLHSSLFYLTPEDFLTCLPNEPSTSVSFSRQVNRIDNRLKEREMKLKQAKQHRIEVRNVA